MCVHIYFFLVLCIRAYYSRFPIQLHQEIVSTNCNAERNLKSPASEIGPIPSKSVQSRSLLWRAPGPKLLAILSNSSAQLVRAWAVDLKVRSSGWVRRVRRWTGVFFNILDPTSHGLITTSDKSRTSHGLAHQGRWTKTPTSHGLITVSDKSRTGASRPLH